MNEKREDGGPAFPPHAHPDSREGQGMSGMSLRDYFAAQCMTLAMEGAGKIKEYEITALFGDRATSIRREQVAAALAYQFADAMIARRTRL